MARPGAMVSAQRPMRRILVLLGWYAHGFHRGIAHYARQEGWVLDCMAMHQMDLRPIWQPDGIICVLGVNPAVDKLVKRLGVPSVSIGHRVVLPTPRVGSDNPTLARMVAEHFAQRGFRHYAYYFKGLFGLCEMERMEAFRQAVARCQGHFHLIDATQAAGTGKQPDAMRMYEFLRRSLAELPKPLAALGYIDDVAVEIITACLEQGLRVPEQVAVIGAGNNELICEFAPVPLSSIDENLEAMGFTAAKLLNDMLNGKHVPPDLVKISPSQVVTRQSSDILAVENVDVAQVLKNIRAHYLEPVTAAQVTADVPISYRRLHDVFIRCVGHSVFDEILRLRLDHAAKLLADTDLKLTEIARASGFSSIDHFGRAFLRKRGMTPGKFRKTCHLTLPRA